MGNAYDAWNKGLGAYVSYSNPISINYDQAFVKNWPPEPVKQDTVIVSGGNIHVLAPEEKVMKVHAAEKCQGRTCVVHRPTDHPMRSFPLTWRADRGIFERQCKHGVGHPDPDQYEYWLEEAQNNKWIEDDPEDYADAQMVHGCCAHRCCIVSK